MAKSKPIKVAIDAADCFTDPAHVGFNFYLYLDPEEREVSTWSHVGAGMPQPVFDRRALMFELPECHGEDLLAWVEENRDGLAAEMDGYQGSEWDGHNWRGRWASDPDEYSEPGGWIASALEKLPTVWPVEEWFHADGGVDGDQLAAYMRDPEGEVARYLREAKDCDQRIDRAELIEYLDVLVAEDQRQAEEEMEYEERLLHDRIECEISRETGGWIVPPECQGQIVTHAYGIDADGGLWRRSSDASDRSVGYTRLGHIDDLECESDWNPAAGEPVVPGYDGDED